MLNDKNPVNENAVSPNTVSEDPVNQVKTGMPILSVEQLAALGEGLVAYLKPVRPEDIGTLFPAIPDMQPGTKLFALHGASGKPLVVTDSRDAALANAMQNELHMVSLH